jgi:exodeoxyribonuclease VII large subunit
MQGTETEQSVINALDRIAEKQQYFDLVVIIRGGGSQTDLSWFDSYNIAYYVTQFPLPVLTGIGHEKDLSVTDLVACRSLKTPTAVADFIIEQTAGTENYITEKGTEIKELALGIIDENKERIERSGKLLFPLATLMISEINRKLTETSVLLMRFGKEQLYRASSETDNLRTRLKSATVSLLKMSGNDLSAMKRRLDILDPGNVLGRGYTITTHNGRILKSASEVTESSLIDTRFIDGIITSTVSNKKNLKE